MIAMFEVGKKYEIRMIIGGEETTMWQTIEKYEHPLVKFADIPASSVEPYLIPRTIHGEIVNVTSPNFISAVLSPDDDATNPFNKL
jgi:hypothetical protein